MIKNDWNEEDWIDTMHRALKFKDNDLILRLRKEVFGSTVQMVNNGYYNKEGRQIDLNLSEDMAQRTIFYDTEERIPATAPRHEHTHIRVILEDTLNAAHHLIGQGKNPCVLNMANRQNPGGAVLQGAGAQEENIFRRSDCYRSLFQFVSYGTQYNITPHATKQYPMDKDFGGIYTPDVTVFRSDEKNGYSLLSQPYRVGLVSVAAISHPEVVDDMISPEQVNPTKNRIRTIFRTAYLNGHHDLVLSAFGCGAFQNPPRHMAQLFKEVLQEDEFHNLFSNIVFAILERDSKNGNNYTSFRDILDGKKD